MNLSVVCVWFQSLKLLSVTCILLRAVSKSLHSKRFLRIWPQAFVKQPVSFQQVEVTCGRNFMLAWLPCELSCRLEEAITTLVAAVTTLHYTVYKVSNKTNLGRLVKYKWTPCVFWLMYCVIEWILQAWEDWLAAFIPCDLEQIV